MKILPAICLSISLSLLSIAAQAETIKIPVGSQTSPGGLPALPQRGELKNNVVQRLGEPLNTSPAIGDPPISSWEYENFTVYFEHNHVIHSVIKHNNENSTFDAN